MDRFELENGFLPRVAKVVAFEAREALGAPYEVRVFVSVPGDADLEPKEGVRTRACLRVNETPDGQPERFHGLVSKCELVRAGTNVALWAVTLRPELAELGLSLHSRVFTHSDLKEILSDVLTEAGFAAGSDFAFEVSDPGPEEEHVTQYKESDEALLHRWAERRGWYYFYEQGDDREKLRVVDSSGAHSSLRGAPIPYRPGALDRSAGEHFNVVRVKKRLSPGSVRVADYDYARPTQPLRGKAQVSASGLGELVYYGARAFDGGAVSKIAQLRAEALACRERVVTLEGHAHHVRAGYLVSMSEHPRPDMDGDYLVVEARCVGRDPQHAGAWGEALPRLEGGSDVYAVQATCIPAKTQYRSLEVTPWPRVFSHENAVVDGAASSQYAQIDADGRYLVRFHFDEGRRKEGQASTRVRMMQPHGGALEGWHMPLRKGTEVVCAFLDGDADRPVIIGVVPNATNPSVVNRGNTPQNVFQTGSASYLTIDDTEGSQWVNLFSPAEQSGLFLGTGRGEGGRAVTSNAAPAIAAEGPGAKKLGPFSVDLRSERGSGRVHTGGDLNVHSHGQLQKVVKGVTNINHMSTLDFDTEGDAEEDLHDTLWHHTVGATTRDHCSTYDLDVTLGATTDFSSTWSMLTNLKRTHRHHDGLQMCVAADADEVCLQPRKIDLHGGYDLDVTGNLTRTITAGQKLDYGSRTIKVKGNYSIKIPAGSYIETVSPEKANRDSAWFKVNLGPVRDNVATKEENMYLHLEVWIGAHLELCYIHNFKVTIGASYQFEGPRFSATGADIEIRPIQFKNGLMYDELKGVQFDLALVRIFCGSYLMHMNGVRTK